MLEGGAFANNKDDVSCEILLLVQEETKRADALTFSAPPHCSVNLPSERPDSAIVRQVGGSGTGAA